MNIFITILSVLVAYILYEIMAKVFDLMKKIDEVLKLHQLQLDELRKHTDLLQDEWREMYEETS